MRVIVDVPEDDGRALLMVLKEKMGFEPHERLNLLTRDDQASVMYQPSDEPDEADPK